MDMSKTHVFKRIVNMYDMPVNEVKLYIKPRQYTEETIFGTILYVPVISETEHTEYPDELWKFYTHLPEEKWPRFCDETQDEFDLL